MAQTTWLESREGTFESYFTIHGSHSMDATVSPNMISFNLLKHFNSQRLRRAVIYRHRVYDFCGFNVRSLSDEVFGWFMKMEEEE
jgi:hypothetical protein